jgi:putative ABC transport system permease protein
MSYVMLDLLPVFFGASLPREAELLAEQPRLTTALVLALAAAVVLGAAPALFGLRGDVAGSLTDSGRASTGRRRFSGLLITAQIALSVPLLMGAILLTKSVLHLRSGELGVIPDRVLSVRITLPREWIGELNPSNLTRVARFFEETVAEARAQPGVVEAGAAVFPPFLANEADRARFEIEGAPELDPSETPRALLHLVTPGFFETLGTKLLSGRRFDARDGMSSQPVMIVSRELVRRWFPDRDPIGTMVTTEWSFGMSSANARTIVGVVEDVAHLGPLEPIEPQIYIPHTQSPFPSMALVVRASGPPESLLRAIRKGVVEREPLAILEDTITLREALAQSLRQPRFYAQLLGSFAAAAALLSALGLYGLLSYNVATQHRELGIRAALGASPRRLLEGVFRRGLTVAAIGLVSGIALALAVVRVLQSLLHGLGPYDPWTIAATPALILLITLLASWLPARRAARVAVVEALRLEE